MPFMPGYECPMAISMRASQEQPLQSLSCLVLGMPPFLSSQVVLCLALPCLAGSVAGADAGGARLGPCLGLMMNWRSDMQRSPACSVRPAKPSRTRAVMFSLRRTGQV